jgi:hypothetical protein
LVSYFLFFMLVTMFEQISLVEADESASWSGDCQVGFIFFILHVSDYV